MSIFIVDVEADGPVPGPYSMVSFGAVKLDRELNTTFYARVAPISKRYNEDALAVSGHSREEHEQFHEPYEEMIDFKQWILKHNKNGRPIFMSDNLAFDWQFINYYFHMFINNNPFGWSGRRIGDLICGYKNDMRFAWKKYRKTKHDHNPVNDAKGNAEALLALMDEGFKLNLK